MFFKRRFEFSEKRLEICRKCEMYNDRTTQCKKCGCFMAAKTLMADAVCPLGKWGEYNESDD
jgi:hypothetical protein